MEKRRRRAHLWQKSYEMPLVPDATPQVNRRIEKLLEWLAFLPKDFGVGDEAERRLDAIVRELGELGVALDPGNVAC